MAPEDLVGRRSAVSRRIAALAFALVLAAMLARVLTLPLPAPHWFAELGVGVFALVYSAIVIRFLDRGWMRGDVVVILRGAVASLIAGKQPQAVATWNAVCLADFGDDGIAFIAQPEIPPRNVNWSSQGKWVHLAKIGFEKYFLSKVRRGRSDTFYERMALEALGIAKLKKVHLEPAE